MNYRLRAREQLKSFREKQVKEVIYMDLTLLSTGDCLYSNVTFFYTYQHKKHRDIMEAEKERLEFIRNSHKVLIDHVLYYACGNGTSEAIEFAITGYHEAMKHGTISIYRLD